MQFKHQFLGIFSIVLSMSHRDRDYNYNLSNESTNHVKPLLSDLFMFLVQRE